MSGPRLLLAALLFMGVMSMGVTLPAGAAEPGYRVQGTRILHGDTAVQLRGVNWFGFETELQTIHGLWRRNWKEMIAQMQGLRINAVRIPVCPATLRGVTPGGIDYDKNPDLRGLNTLELLDKVVTELDARGMHVLIDHHRPDCEAISELWYTDDYSEDEWLADLAFIARRYRAFGHFMGIDLKNEPHGKATWGAGKKATDWNAAAERAAEVVLDAAPNILVFVEGISDTGRCTDAPPAWWGGNLAPMSCTPLDIPDDRLVLSPHVYGPDVHPQPYFDTPDFPDNLPAIWDAHFGQFAEQGFAIVPGEFGGRYGHAGDPRDRTWQNALIDYLRKKNITSGFYWSWNPNSGDTGGLLQNDWQTVWPTKLALLDHFWFGTQLAELPPIAEQQAPPEKPTPPKTAVTRTPAGADQLEYTVQTLSDWGAGYCVDVAVNNNGGKALQWQFEMPAEGRINNLWNARYQRSGDNIEVRGVDWNRSLAAGAQTHFGYCAMRDADEQQGELVSVADSDDLEVDVNVESRWQSGYCARVTVRNRGQTTLAWRAEVAVEGRVHNLWRGEYRQQGGRIIVTGKDYNRQIEPGGEEHFGFCAQL